ncbi:MAG: hypothetical protein KA603_09065 [Azonexus sp.]|nr:hypothetical protein [Betaproteobacteria bacterium]MBK8919501.1 hypothetical protein [Betaproteobacteria bacterium]MBP6036269.1 hypothetical protein [Azonexus sp.]MBP6906867.1 hypothetical protein [Azonexus sp.]
MHKLLDRLPLNTDVEAEFHYWTGQLRGAVVTALVVAVACGAAITLLPGRAEDPDGYGFMKAHWPHLLEVAFWFGLLVGLVWSAAKRLGGALAGSLPWKPEADCCEQESSARLFGGWGMFLALAGSLFWLAHQIALVAGGPADGLQATLAPLWMASLATAPVLLAAAWYHRPRPARPPRPFGAQKRPH